MKFCCTNNDDMEGILTVGRVYTGEMAYPRNYIKIFRCDDSHPGYFEGYRFQEVVDSVLSEPVVKINHYTLIVD
jgi:hypothetical protein